MKDLISRQMAIDEFYMDTCDTDRVAWAENVLKRVPTAQPQHKSAYLIAPHPYGRCSNCGQLIDIRDKYNYCPMCGRRLNHG